MEPLELHLEHPSKDRQRTQHRGEKKKSQNMQDLFCHEDLCCDMCCQHLPVKSTVLYCFLHRQPDDLINPVSSPLPAKPQPRMPSSASQHSHRLNLHSYRNLTIYDFCKAIIVGFTSDLLVCF